MPYISAIHAAHARAALKDHSRERSLLAGAASSERRLATRRARHLCVLYATVHDELFGVGVPASVVLLAGTWFADHGRRRNALQYPKRRSGRGSRSREDGHVDVGEITSTTASSLRKGSRATSRPATAATSPSRSTSTEWRARKRSRRDAAHYAGQTLGEMASDVYDAL